MFTHKKGLKVILPYISLFSFLVGVCLVLSVVNDLNPNLISNGHRKFIGIVFAVSLVIFELSGKRDYLWKLWKKMPGVVHFVVSFFFSFIILKIAPLAIEKVWNEEDKKQTPESTN